jgi:hypothetical protein
MLLVKYLGHSKPGEIDNFNARVTDLVAAGSPGETVVIVFGKDPANQYYQVVEENGARTTDRNELIDGFITLDSRRSLSPRDHTPFPRPARHRERGRKATENSKLSDVRARVCG